MAIGDANAGYMGTASITGIGSFRFQDASLAATQEVNAPDLVMGDYDHDAWNYGPITVGGSIAGPMTDNFAANAINSVWGWGWDRGNCGSLNDKDVTLNYFCNRGTAADRSSRTFTGMLVNSMQISCSAGDIAQFSLDLLGTGVSDWGSGDPTPNESPEKLITWDKVNVRVIRGVGGASNINYSNFDVTVANNLETQYSLNQGDLFPFDIVPGMRTITGTLTAYNADGGSGYDAWGDYSATTTSDLEITLGGAAPIVFTVAFHRIQPSLNPGVITSTVGFTGVTHQTT